MLYKNYIVYSELSGLIKFYELSALDASCMCILCPKDPTSSLSFDLNGFYLY